MKRPERIRVFGKNVTIKYCSGSDPLSEDQVGECDLDAQLILVRDAQPLESEQDTLLHEVTHAVDEAMGLKLKEAQVKGCATGLLAVMKDNPGFVRYLATKGKK